MSGQRQVQETREAILQAGTAVGSPALDLLPNLFALDSHDLKDCSLEDRVGPARLHRAIFRKKWPVGPVA